MLKQVVYLSVDGLGIGKSSDFNIISLANKPNLDLLSNNLNYSDFSISKSDIGLTNFDFYDIDVAYEILFTSNLNRTAEKKIIDSFENGIFMEIPEIKNIFKYNTFILVSVTGNLSYNSFVIDFVRRLSKDSLNLKFIIVNESNSLEAFKAFNELEYIIIKSRFSKIHGVIPYTEFLKNKKNIKFLLDKYGLIKNENKFLILEAEKGWILDENMVFLINHSLNNGVFKDDELSDFKFSIKRPFEISINLNGETFNKLESGILKGVDSVSKFDIESNLLLTYLDIEYVQKLDIIDKQLKAGYKKIFVQISSLMYLLSSGDISSLTLSLELFDDFILKLQKILKKYNSNFILFSLKGGLEDISLVDKDFYNLPYLSSLSELNTPKNIIELSNLINN